ncbi:IPTL-CTERM sorting domain-containing protein [Acidovorax sp. JMULE5]|uniref:IPTL-CTERM sorting domain-containing protein n=1 Tax=Acidovorax sp. JMULE5 TaxID=2518343 RepID=UPI0015A13BF8|nr:IPTL-CTERM sorting domain-containing protein [Acidovorax sp. JMULE5]
MFDIDAANTVTLTGLDANISGSGTFELYYRVGGYAGHENNPGDWTLLATSASVTSLGLNLPTPVPMPLAVVLSAGTRYGFYLTENTGAGSGAVRYTNGTNAALANDANLTVYSGVGKQYPFASTNPDRRFNGTIHYALGIVSVADLSITKTDGVTTVNPGGGVTYTITASNAGPSDAPGTVVSDTLPVALTGATWTCVGAGGGTCTASGSGSINDTVSLPAGASVTYTLSAVVSAAASGTLSNTATVTEDVSVVDPTSGNNSATDSDSITPRADLSITKTDGATTVNPGGGVTYTITASNAGPNDAPGTVVADALPAALTSATWTCVGAGGGTCTASGSGSINDTVNLPAGASVTYTLSAVVSASASGTLGNTATVTAAGGIVDPTPGNNSATDSDSITPRADLSITKTDGVTTVNPGGGVTYTITASNAGPSDAPGTVVADVLPAALTSATWTCVGAGGGTCTASGSGSINDTVNLPAGATVTYTLSAVVSASASGTLSNTATVTTAGGVVDLAPGNNSATDSDTIAPATCLRSNIPTLVSGVTATLSATGCSAVDSATFVQPAPGAPTNTTFPYGLFDFTLSGSASTVTVTVTYSQNLPSAATFYKVNGAAYSSYPASVGVNSVTFTLTDNDAWDGNSAPGVIRDPSGLGFASSPTSIPTLSEWGTILLSCLMAVAVFVAMRRRST